MKRHHSDSPSSAAAAGKPRRRMFKYLMTGGVLGALFAGGLGLASSAGAMPWSGPGCRVGMFGGHGHHGPMNPEEMRARLEFGTDWILNKVEATPTQREQVKTAMLAALKDLEPLGESHRANRDAFSAALAADTIDRAKLESLRTAELQLAERASQRMVQALADAADALEPAQRRKLAEMAKKFDRRP